MLVNSLFHFSFFLLASLRANSNVVFLSVSFYKLVNFLLYFFESFFLNVLNTLVLYQTYQVSLVRVSLHLTLFCIWWLINGSVTLFTYQIHFLLKHWLVWLAMNKNNISRFHIFLNYLLDFRVIHSSLYIRLVELTLAPQKFNDIVLNYH